jgi:hypothetical protein
LPAEVVEKLGENELVAIGTGAIIKGNIAQAKGSALSHALSKGLEIYLLRRLGSEGVVNNFQRLLQEIMPNAQEKIENFYILAEGQIGTEYKVLARIKINEKVMGQVLREAGLVLMEGAPIKVLFLVSEVEEGAVTYWWKDPEHYTTLSPSELALHNVFQERGFSPVNRSLRSPESGLSGESQPPDLQETDIIKWGKLFSVDVVIYGQTIIDPEREISLELKAFDVNQGLKISQGTHFGSIEKLAEGGEPKIETLERLVSLLAARFVPPIIQFISTDRRKIQHLEISLVGLSTLKQLKAFKNFLIKDVAGVMSVRPTRIKRDSTSFAVEFQGDRDRFLSRVLNHENLPFALKLDRTEQGEIIFTAR